MTNYINDIKGLRLLRGIRQENMLEEKNRSQFSKIEHGKLSIRFDDFIEMATSLGLTAEELIVYTTSNEPQEQLLILFRECAKDLTDNKKKQKFLKLFEPIQKKQDSDLSRIEYNFKYSVKAVFSTYWAEIKAIPHDKISILFEHLITNDYFSQYDYMLALNLSKYFSKQQMKTIITKMIPLKNMTARNALCQQYANLLLTNAISFFIYEKEYKLALKYIYMAQKELCYTDSYYLHLNLLYHKNLALSLYKNETKYITETRKVIQIIESIGDSTTADVLTNELDHFVYHPNDFIDKEKGFEMSANT